MKRMLIHLLSYGSLLFYLLPIMCRIPAAAQNSCPPPSNGVNVCFPATSTTQANPVHFIAASATTTCSKGISAMGIYSAPGDRVYVVNGSTLDTFLPLSPGIYNATVQEWDNCGGSLKEPITVTVTGTANYTYQYNNQRSGANTFEATLTPSNVNSTSFGKKFADTVDGYIYGQPLYVPNMSIAGGTHNVVFVATENNTIYAFDGDAAGSPLWKSHIDYPVPCAPVNGCGVAPGLGITSTPVIDPAQAPHGAIYVEGRTDPGQGSVYYQGLHKLDLTTGVEMPGSPKVISASVHGTGYDNSGDVITFNNTRENNRSALLYANGVIYLAFSSLGDTDPFHGWLLGYGATTMQQLTVFNTTPNAITGDPGERGGIWGGGMAADLSNTIFADTGNGTYDGVTDWGESYLKLQPNGGTMSVLDWFTPFNYVTLNNDDLDLGSAGSILLPPQPGSFPDEMIGSGKAGTIYVVNRDSLGHFHAGSDSQIIQSLLSVLGHASDGQQNYSTPAYWNETMFFFAVQDNGKAFSLTNGLLSTAPTSTTTETYPFPGTTPTVSASSSTRNGIVWAVSPGTPGALYAYNATTLKTELYNSNQDSSRDNLGDTVKFAPPLVINGKVYVGTRTQLVVYGLLQ